MHVINNLVQTKFVEIFGRAEQVLSTKCVGYLTPLGKQTLEEFYIYICICIYVVGGKRQINYKFIPLYIYIYIFIFI